MATNLVESDISRLLTQYEFGPAEVLPIRNENNSVYKVITEQDAYALRIHRPHYRTPEQTISELHYLQGLAGALSVPLPVRTKSGDLVTRFQQGKRTLHASIITWLDGDVRRPQGKGAGPKTIYRIGQSLGHIHAFSEGFRPSEGFDLPTWDSEGIFGSRSQFCPGPLAESFTRSQVDVLKMVRSRFEAVVQEIGVRQETYGVIHNDVILLNCLHHGNKTSVIDFDDCGWGYYLYDLGGMLENLKDYSSYRTLRRALLDGYRSIRRLPMSWERHFDLMIAARHAITAIWMAGKWRAGDVERDRFEEYVKYRLLEAEENL